jgi:ribonuclease BN (tRNA processing enzyme)
MEELFIKETIRSIENTWLRRQRSKKRKRIIGYNFYYQEIEEENNYILAKENMEHIYFEVEREVIDYFDNQKKLTLIPHD